MPDDNFMFTLQQAAAWLPDAHGMGDMGTRIARVHTDTRSVQPGDLFVALRGESFDGAQFLTAAREAGAIAAVVNADVGALLQASGLPGLCVPDTHQALMALAKAWRAQFDLPLIAVTGSNGKTTVTQMIASILAAWHPTAHHATQGNFNNEIGVPLTLLKLRPHHRASVVELGMNHPGEIERLADVTRPTVALVNNAQREHQEHMGTVHAVALENGSVFGFLPADGTAVYPEDDDYASVWADLSTTVRHCLFAIRPNDAVSVSLRAAQWMGNGWQVQAQSPAGEVKFTLHIAGRHNLKNALAAIACAHAIGVPTPSIEQGLSAFQPVKGRSRAVLVHWGDHDITLIDDTYNANPDSVRAAIDVLVELPKPSLLVLGDMGEVGENGPEFHREVGEYARLQGIDAVWTLGDLASQTALAFGTKAWHAPTAEALIDQLKQNKSCWASVLVKGSRFMRMERVVEAVMSASEAQKEKKNAG